MTIREQIISVLDTAYIGDGSHYITLKACLSPAGRELFTSQEEEGFDNWFRGVIESLYYNPNKTMLILVGEERTPNSKFFRDLLPYEYMEDYYIENNRETIRKFIYECLIGNIDDVDKKSQDLCEQDNFIILPQAQQLIDPGTDKRLLSYCGTTNAWHNPQRKNVTVLHLESIDWELYNSIDKLALWKEIFYLFKPTL